MCVCVCSRRLIIFVFHARSTSASLASVSLLCVAHEGVGRGLRRLRKEWRIGIRLSASVALMSLGIAAGCAKSNVSDICVVLIVSAVFAVDFAVEFEGSKFDASKCGCDEKAEAPCLQRIISERNDLIRQQSAAVNPVIAGGRESSIDSLAGQTGGPPLPSFGQEEEV